MEKFLSIPVTDEQNQLVSCNNIKLIEQADQARVIISYGDGLRAIIAHATAPLGNETQRDKIQSKVVEALQTKWTNVTLQVSDLPYAVSGITILPIT